MSQISLPAHTLILAIFVEITTQSLHYCGRDVMPNFININVTRHFSNICSRLMESLDVFITRKKFARSAQSVYNVLPGELGIKLVSPANVMVFAAMDLRPGSPGMTKSWQNKVG